MMTAQWWPWYRFALSARVPAAAFRPTMTCRGSPLVAETDRQRYQALVHRVFTGRGRGTRQIVRAACPGVADRRLASWAVRHAVSDRDLPRRLTAEAWADLFDLARSAPPGTGGSVDGAVRRGRRGPDRRRRTGAPGERPGSGRRRGG